MGWQFNAIHSLFPTLYLYLMYCTVLCLTAPKTICKPKRGLFPSSCDLTCLWDLHFWSPVFTFGNEITPGKLSDVNQLCGNEYHFNYH